ncbi:branched-chain amino acid ABC transporter permease [Micromonospora sp. CPCC 206061]|uniref:branched-chain amino acid ABC transporter permease n=1 Tax=Micromonospora sp. CPCC 206061 TaxID=3122410 RepID=UPI002FF174A3
MSVESTTAEPMTVVDPAGRQRHPRPRSVGVTAAVVLTALALPAVVDAYTISIASTALVLATLAMSAQLVTGVAGLPSLGQAAYLGVGAYTAALLANAGYTNGPTQLAAAALTGAAAAAVTAPLVLRTRGTTFLMVTFAVAEVGRTAASQWAAITGGDDGLHTPPVTVWPGTAPLRVDGYIYLYVLVCFLVLAALVALLLRTRLALVLRGAADHEPRLGALGHRVTAALTAGFLAAGAVAGAGGALLVAVNRYLSPADMGLDVSALALLAAAIGAGSMRGAVAGAVLVVAVRDLLGTDTGGHATAVLGAVFLLVAYRRPAQEWLRTRVQGGRR